MRALMITGVESCAWADIPEPTPGPGEVLLAVRHLGLCGSDLATYLGQNPLVSLPRIPGHEIGGVVVAAGPEVPADYAPGRRAVVLPYTSCGTCSSCRCNRVNACRSNRTLGVQQDGGLTERLVLPYGKVLLNETLPERTLALVEPLSVGFHAAARGRIAAGEKVVVLGCGMIGLGAVAAAAHRGAEVIAVDISPAKLALATRYGARHTLDARCADLSARVRALTASDGADVAIETVGLPLTFTQAVDLAAYSGRVVSIGYCKEPVSFETKFFNLKELDFLGSRNATLADFAAVITWLEARDTPPDDVISKVFPFAEAAQALPYWQANRAETLKVMIAWP
jgi:threonine dehydrogenase-like Zn-dependent dehydrogenase